MRILVLGGAGFIGRHVVRALHERGHATVIGSRSRRPFTSSSSHGGAVLTEALPLHCMLRPGDWLAPIADVDVIVNCVGILRERWGERYDAIYMHAPAALAEACRQESKRFIHITALGLDADANSGFIRCKRAGELAIARIGGEHCIVRPSLLDGDDGFGSRWLRRVAHWPIHPVPADASGQLAPLHVDDLADAIAALCECPASELPASVELGGEQVVTIAGYLHALRAALKDSRGRAPIVAVPGWLVQWASHLLDLLHLTPLSYGHVELLRRDNRPRAADTRSLRRWLGRAPMAAGAPSMSRTFNDAPPVLTARRRPA